MIRTPSNPWARALPVLCLATCVSGACATYPERTAKAYSDFERGELQRALDLYADPKTTDSAFLAGAEAGTVALTAGDWEAALRHLHAAEEAVSDVEDRALVSAADLGEGLMSWAFNDAQSAYSGEGYERVQVHAALAIAYLALGRLDDVAVEARVANKLLETEEELYEKEYAAGGLGHYLSAISYELMGRLDDAYIDYRRMHEKGVGRDLAGRALVRLASDLRYDDELSQWIDTYGPEAERFDDAASIIVIAGVGSGPFKVEQRITIPTNDGLLPWAVPSIRRRPQSVTALRLVLPASDASVATTVIEDVAHVAGENLDDRIAWLAAKSAIRSVLKRELSQKLGRDHGVLGALAGNLFALASERADLRAWQTLPDTWQAARMFVPAGEHDLRIEALGPGSYGAPGAARADLGRYLLEPGETLFVFARSVGSRVHVHPIGGLRIAGPGAPGPSGEAALEPVGTPAPGALGAILGGTLEEPQP